MCQGVRVSDQKENCLSPDHLFRHLKPETQSGCSPRSHGRDWSNERFPDRHSLPRARAVDIGSVSLAISSTAGTRKPSFCHTKKCQLRYPEAVLEVISNPAAVARHSLRTFENLGREFLGMVKAICSMSRILNISGLLMIIQDTPVGILLSHNFPHPYRTPPADGCRHPCGEEEYGGTAPKFCMFHKRGLLPLPPVEHTIRYLGAVPP